VAGNCGLCRVGRCGVNHSNVHAQSPRHSGSGIVTAIYAHARD
jgi:hypothetical protein